MRFSLIAVLLLLIASLLCRQAVDAVVEVPLRVDAVPERFPAPHQVRVRTIKKRPSNVACGHSPICAILLPIIFYELAFPKKYQSVAVTASADEAAPLVFSGSYTMDGDFLNGTLHEGNLRRHVGRLPLRQLKRTVVLELSRQAGREPPVPSDIFAQYDFRGAYASRLPKTSGSGRGQLLAEAYGLGAELDELVFGALKDAGDEATAAFVRGACQHRHRRAEAGRFLNVGFVRGSRSRLAIVDCAARELVYEGLVHRLWAQTIAAACRGEHTPKQLRTPARRIHGNFRRGAGTKIRRLEAAALADCTDRDRRAEVALFLAHPLSVDDVESLLSSRKYAGRTIASLDLRRPAERLGAFRTLERGSDVDRKILERIVRRRLELSPEECRAVAKNYTIDRESSFLTKSDRMFRRRAYGLALLRACRIGREVIEAAYGRASPEDRPLYDAALAVMGDRDRMLRIRKQPGPAVPRPARVHTRETLLLYARGLVSVAP